MEKQPKLKLSQYDEKWNKTGEVEISASEIGDNINDEQMVELLDNYIKRNFREYRNGNKIGKLMENSHRTLQASLFRWALGICVGLSERTVARNDGSTYESTDGRNEMSVACGKKIKELIDSGELKMGYMI